MKKLPILALFFVPMLGLAHTPPNNDDRNLGPGSPIGLPKFGEGVKVVPLSQMNLPKEVKQKILRNMQIQKTKGYVESDSMWPKQLLRMGQGLVKVDAESSVPDDTNLKKSLSQIQLAFPFKGVPNVEAPDIIGYAVSGMWNDGWSGIAEFFNKKEIGTCKFMLSNFAVSQGASMLSEEVARYDVNKKPTTISISGSQATGFLYEVRWADNKFRYDLECANDSLDPGITKRTINLAKTVDKYTNN